MNCENLLDDIRAKLQAGDFQLDDSGLLVSGRKLHIGLAAPISYTCSIKQHIDVIRAVEQHDPEMEAWARARLFETGKVYDLAGYEETERSVDRNLVPTLGLNFLLDAMFGSTAKKSTWYLGLFTSNSTPVAGWGPDWGKTSGGSATELAAAQMVTQTTRPAATFGSAAAAGVLASSAATQITLAEGVSGLSLYGATLNSSSTIAYSGTSEILISAVRFASTKTGLGAGDKADIEYEITATST